MGDDALLLAPDDGDMDFGDINCDLLDADDDELSGADKTNAVSSQGDDLRLKVELKKISRMSSGVFEGLKPESSKKKANRSNHFKHMLYGNFKRRTTPLETENRGLNLLERKKSLFTKNYKIPLNKDPRSRPASVETPKSPVQDRPPLFTKNYRNQPRPQSPSCAAGSLPLKVAESFPAHVSGTSNSNTFPPDFTMPPPSTASSASRLVINRDHQPSTPNSSSSPVFSPKNSPPSSSLFNTSIEQLEKMKSEHETKKREEEARMEELERILARKKMEENIQIKEREREAALIRQLKIKQELEAPMRDLNPTQNFFSGQARTKPNLAPEVDMANLIAQQLKMMQEMTNSFMTNMAERDAERKLVQEKKEMTELKTSIKNMEQMLFCGQINKSPFLSTVRRAQSHAYMDRLNGPVPVKERLALPMKDEFDIKRLSSYNNNESASKRYKSDNGQFGNWKSLPDDLVLTEITENGPKAARKKITFSADKI